MDFLKMAQNADFLLFILGIFWMDISEYIQKTISTCDHRIFSLVTAALVYVIIKKIFLENNMRTKGRISYPVFFRII